MNMNIQAQHQVVQTGAVQRIKTFGTFVAGGCVGALIAGAMYHVWDYGKSNGFNPFGDGGKSVYKTSDSRAGTATQSMPGSPRLLTSSAGQGEINTLAAIPVMLVSSAEASDAETRPFVMGKPSGAASSSAAKPVIQMVRQQASSSTPHKQQGSQTAHPRKQASQGDTKPPANKVAQRTVTRPAPVPATWVGRLMPGQAVQADYYNYIRNPKPQERAAQQGTWVARLMGEAPVKVNKGKPAQFQTPSKSSLHTGAGNQGDRLNGGGNALIWSEKGDAPLSGVTVCIKKECV
ncbi:MAG TPA: hypothetical protein PLE99_05975 [Candidatus Thiothrix moscowensis]|uniref:hypothetical protein n=1 Tax=unclassified Thiothrix TaxID=2636184 RepID=UPI0025F6A569|nr:MULTISPECIES: hypothetical protein [unclassified Thiothrix]HRJ52293.1 hypothetical protein [Candidatus Thiothrix moscowensis]HRJ92608.1 hypothetical protein [Candidatus Thiothrix moscowensis]